MNDATRHAMGEDIARRYWEKWIENADEILRKPVDEQIYEIHGQMLSEVEEYTMAGCSKDMAVALMLYQWVKRLGTASKYMAIESTESWKEGLFRGMFAAFEDYCREFEGGTLVTMVTAELKEHGIEIPE
jgi:hypothetical protein